MKPVRLKISGLNSFIEEQTIEFDQLTENGLFGIFGPTGSGKSTILDAITLALYGRVPRSGGKPSGIINTQCDKIKVSYEFAIGEGAARRHYSVLRILKKTANEGTKTEQAIIYDISNPECPDVLHQGSKDVNAGIEEIIGLTADDFTRSVVLPQGSFSEFLRLNGTERRNMLERIFSLEKYGEQLKIKISRYKSKKKLDRSQLEGLLSSYGDISPAIYDCLSEEIEKMQAARHIMVKSWEQVDKQYQETALLWQWQEELRGYQQEALRLLAQKGDFQNMAQAIQKAEKAARLRTAIEKIEAREEALQQKNRQLINLERELDEVLEHLATVQTGWEEASRRKDQELPGLITSVNNLQRAVEINGRIKVLTRDMASLNEEYKQLTGQLEMNNNQLETIQEQIQVNQVNLGTCREKIAHLKIAPQTRELLNKAYPLEKEYGSLQKRNEELLTQITSLQANLKIIEEELSSITITGEEMKNKWQAGQDKKKLWEDNCPGNNDDLLLLQEEINQLKIEIKELEKLLEGSRQAQTELAGRQEQKIILEKELAMEKENLAALENEFQELKAHLDKSREKNMALLLAQNLRPGAPCPVCGSCHHPVPSTGTMRQEIEVGGKARLALEAQKENQMRKVQNLELEYQAWLRDMGQKELFLENLKKQTAGRNLSTVIDTCRSREIKFSQLKVEIDKWQTEVRHIREEEISVKEHLARLQSAQASKQTAWQKDKELLKRLQNDLDNGSKNLSQLKKEYSDCLAVLKLDTVEKRVREVQRQDREIASLEKEEKGIDKRLKELENQQFSRQEGIKQLEIKKTQLIENGRGKREVLDRLRIEVNQLSQDDDPVKQLTAVEKTIEEIKNQYQRLGETREKVKQQQEILTRQYAQESGDKNTLEELWKDEEKELAGTLDKYGFASREEAWQSFRGEDEIQGLKEAAAAYENQVNINQGNMERLKDKLPGDNISEEEWGCLQENRNRLQEDLEEVKNQLLLKVEKQKQVAHKLQELQGLQAKKKELDQQYGLLEELESLFSGKKFVEFIARTQLSYIARAASQTLKDISRGRYALEINSEGEFIMRDDFNGGARRPTHTLSGGETFLASLSLALALSSHIQLGKASLEFFFLDEGFGTLDAELLDTVMGALEKLHSQKLSVGIISHVEELKQRLPRKLIVTPAVPGVSGSRVAIE